MNLVALDIETTGLNPRRDRIHGVGVFNGTKGAYLNADDVDLRKFLADKDNHIVGHNIRFDLKFLINAGMTINCRIWDTKLLAQLVDENQPLGLKALSEKYFGKSSLTNKLELDRAVSSVQGRSVADLCRLDLDDETEPFYHIIKKYCLEDCKNTYKLWFSLIPAIKKLDKAIKSKNCLASPLDYYMNEMMPLEQVLLSMELDGIHLDEAALNAYKDKLLAENVKLLAEMSLICAKEINKIEEDLYEKVLETKHTPRGKANVQRRSVKSKTKFNWQSSEHLASLIFGQFKIPEKLVEKTATGKPSTSESSLEVIFKAHKETDRIHKVLATYKAWKKNIKILNTYTGDAVEKTGLLAHVDNGRVYAEYLQTGRDKEDSSGGTVTGRLSSRNPNMQNLPRGSEVKKFFLPDPGQIFVYFDYSQLELRLAAHLSNDRLLLQGYNDGIDLHQITADAIGADRQTGKAVNFAMIYDASAYRLTDMINKPVEECRDIIDQFYGLYQGYKRYLEEQRKFIENNYCVISEAGRLRRLPAIEYEPTGSREWRHALKQGYNFPIQSLGATITKKAMIQLHSMGYRIVTQVHDSVVISIPNDNNVDRRVAEIKQVAENVYPLRVPLKVDIKLLTSLSESDIISNKEKTHEPKTSQYSRSG